ncbi:hypothetical protein [Rufibacter radiotolerans]|uniref:hypothetical protein n=1 Tax=Rufibacter radiotolerans TaxID=1379910 RepID=UPI0006646F50|nr:hypothetical protein [Rufibacter radiotolerans]
MIKEFKVLTTFWYLMGLAVLLLNDFILKGFYGNWLTGKLSDFAGLFIFPLFWLSLLSKHKKLVFILTGLLFVWWKSPLSDPFIGGWNSKGIWPITREVDYSDLVALIVLPLGYHFGEQQKLTFRVTIPPVIPLMVSAFAFMATSYSSKAEINKTYLLDMPKNTLIMRFADIDSLNSGNGVEFSDRNPDTVNFSLPSKFCFGYFDVKVSVSELPNGKTLLTLLEANHRCPKKDDNIDNLTKEFERVIVSKIKNKP